MTGTTPLIAQTFGRIGSAQPDARVAEHPHPRRILAPLPWMPGHLHCAEDALWMRHENRKPSISGGQTGDAARRPIRIVWIHFGRGTAIVDEAQGGEDFGGRKLRLVAKFRVA